MDLESFKIHRGPTPGPGFGPVVGSPAEWISGLSYEKWINGGYQNPVPCIPIRDSSTADILIDLPATEERSVAPPPGDGILLDTPAFDLVVDQADGDILVELPVTESRPDAGSEDILVELPATESRPEESTGEILVDLPAEEGRSDSGTMELLIEIESTETFS